MFWFPRPLFFGPRAAYLKVFLFSVAMCSGGLANARAEVESKIAGYPSQFDSHGFHDVRVNRASGGGIGTTKQPKGVVIFLKPVWLGAEANDVAKRLARESRLVITVDPKKFKVPDTKDRRQCASLSDCLVALSAYVQRNEKLAAIYNPSVLSIAETGAMAEEAWREAPLAAFNVIISVDYCPKSVTEPQLSAEHRTLWSIVASPKALKDCQVFKSGLLPLADIERGLVTASPRLKTGPLIRWVSDRLNKIERDEARLPANHLKVNLEDLHPVVMDPQSAKTYDSFVILYSGDGGWAEFTDELATGMNKLSMPVVGINSMRYFWKAKTPEGGAQDLERLIRHFSERWKSRSVHLVGFSFGAGTLPFFTRRLPDEIRKQVRTIALLAPYRKADFEFSLSDWFFDDDRGGDVLPEIKQLGVSVRPLCIYPIEERSQSLCTQEPGAPMASFELPGGHHFGNDVDRVVRLLFPETRPK